MLTRPLWASIRKKCERRIDSRSMNQEQLRFNLDMAPDPVRLATSFKLRPSPVIIERLLEQSSASSVTSSSTELSSLEARMELASRLARRDIESSKLHVGSWIPGGEKTSLPNRPQNVQPRFGRVKEQQQPIPRKKAETKINSQPCKKAPCAASESATTRGLVECSACLHQHSSKSKKSEQELARVRKELTRQAYRLRQLTLAPKPGHFHSCHPCTCS